MVDTVQIRAARPEDKELVLAFCMQTWEWGDYLPEVWDTWMADPQGKLLVADYAGQPVAVVHAVMVAPTEGWLEGLRTDPRYRRRGIATRLNDGAISMLREWGARVVRLASYVDNVAAHRLVERAGFRRAGAFIPFAAAAMADAGEPRTVLGPADRERVLRFLARSNVFPVTGGLIYIGWKARELTAEVVAERLASGQVLAIGEETETGLPLALAFIAADRDAEDHEPALRVEYVDGETDAVSHLALALRQEAGQRGLPRVTAQLPDVLVIQDAFRGAEYTNRTDGIFLVFAKAV
jgi:ribosomal protein S18 acetylase RimI-like enzyme